MSFLIIIGGILTVTLIPLLARRFLYPHPLPGIPYDKDAVKRITGDSPRISATYKELTEWLYPIVRRQSLQLQSPVSQLFMNPFSKPLVIVDDPRELADLIRRRTKEFDRDITEGVFGTLVPYSTIAQATTPEWKKQRRIWHDTMHPNFLHRVVAKNTYSAVKDLIKLWDMRCAHSDDQPIDVRMDFSFATLDTLWVATFGESLDLVDSQIQMLKTGKQVETKGSYAHTTAQYINEFGETLTGFWPALTRWWIQRSSKYRKYMADKDRELGRILFDAFSRFKIAHNGSRDSEEHDTCAMDLVIRRSIYDAQKAGKPIPDPTKDAKMKDELLLFIYAGHDTTSTTLQWFVKHITNNEGAQAKLREALRIAFPGDSLPSITDLLAKNIPYLDAVIEESLRCGATAPRVMRIATVDTEIFGHRIPAGTRVWGLTSANWHPIPVPEERRSLSSQAALEKSGGVDWTQTPSAQDFDKYIPERWLKINKDGKEIFDPTAVIHNPFGGGVRGCFGKRLAMMEIRIMVVSIVMSFKFLPVPPEFNSFQVTQKLLRSPRQCFVKLKTV
ncbi:Cytochrome P450 3A24 [Daldinia childiae]|uniref:Cytochrome P450 3A24 n=1 Tax=Daldinia childiae TaxID=326645 RepID=UPI0014466298|nr:Cytochrome P450 3A24 [Daldinia childiae]KAF3071299.1 Cytochrome P450 3A24 [Daldinia childiae]